MQTSRKISLLILALYLFSIFSPITAYAQPTGSAAAVQAAAEALSMGSGASSGSSAGSLNEEDADTGLGDQSENPSENADIHDPA